MHGKASNFSNHPLELIVNKNVYLNKHRLKQGIERDGYLSLTPEGPTAFFKSSPED